ncbi:MAG TPA: hypothetical protein VFT90_05050 [Chryseosolibacter sp.]|nr:hypothetical protein [Chryseosolibacter sp.]
MKLTLKTRSGLALLIVLVLLSCNQTQQAYETPNGQYRTEVSQYGITWTFDKPAKTGQFVTGDWWVQGPVTIIKITPAPGPVANEETAFMVNRWNDTSLKSDSTMRNGAMIVARVGTRQGYDSRAAGYSADETVRLPLVLQPDVSLISSISNKALPVDNFAKEIMWPEEKTSETVMRTAAVLTCVKEVPPRSGFRPPYAGTLKPIYRADEILWDQLPSLSPAGEVPSWELFERYFQRPWIDHVMSWSQQQLVPNENGPNYGREHARIVSIASLLLALDVPREKKQKLTIGLIQRGIDLYGLAMAGGYWNEGGGHSSGRKWPILFASIMLGEPELSRLPETAIFQEDTQTYYGKGWFGQTALYWMIQHHGKRERYEEKPPESWEKWDKTTESYRLCCNATGWVGTALAARYMKAIKLWNHDAHFDYVDRWMREDDPYEDARGKHKRPKQETTTFDPFVTAMWKAHRKHAPEQDMAGNPRMWVWGEGRSWRWIPNSKPEE